MVSVVVVVEWLCGNGLGGWSGGGGGVVLLWYYGSVVLLWSWYGHVVVVGF